MEFLPGKWCVLIQDWIPAQWRELACDRGRGLWKYNEAAHGGLAEDDREAP
jgi:hypothetical protein